MAKFDRVETIYQDSTAMKYLKSCDRKYFYRIVLGFDVRKQKYQLNLDWGTARHKFREVLENTGGDIKAAMEAGLSVKLTIPDPRDYGAKKFDYLNKERLIKMFAIDYDLWEKEKAQNKIFVLHTEQPLNVQLPDGSIVAGRVDQGVEWAGQIWDRDWKTSSKDKAYFAGEKDPDDQASRYIYIFTKLHGQVVGGVIFDVIYNAKTIENEHYTHIVSKTPKQLAQWEKEQIQVNRQLALNREHDTWPMREGNCKFCEFRSVCTKPNELSQMAELESSYVKRPWNFQDPNGDEL